MTPRIDYLSDVVPGRTAWRFTLYDAVPGRTSWRFKVRVTRIWEVTGYLREWFFLMGGKIHSTVRKQLLYLFQRKLEERLVYVLFVVDAKDLILILCFISSYTIDHLVPFLLLIVCSKSPGTPERYGFEQIGEPLPDNVTLKDVIASLPKKVFEIDDVKAWKTVLISATCYALGLLMISKAPWYLLPLAWAWTGTAVTGFFVIGHDCAHKSFSTNKLVEDIVGTLAFLPLIYPYEPWRFKHDKHHAKTNMLKEDTAWQPVWKDEFESKPLLRKAIIFGNGPFRCWMSIAHWLVCHFNLKTFRPNEIKRVKISLACVFAFMAIGWPLIIYKTGIMGWIKFWLMPWLGYHFW
ncbi:unnamed protein product [Trifolium pratense]|uniref:Uncharacterized protein n=1 Tax=Trifolium pratense TaxID=57577 RepID=A0ACB0MGG7_TRIPR|nr:unnamed protein product [Trifolium pratense]